MNEIEKIERPAATLIDFVAMAVKDPAIDVTKLEALLRMQREIIADDAKAQFNEAFIRLQGRLPRIKKNGVLEYPIDKNNPNSPKRKISNFMKWEDVDEAIRPILDEEGFAISWNTAPRAGDGGGLIVTAILRHRAGYSQETSMPVPLDGSGGKNNLQGYGSTLSYGRRYTACAALNIVAEGEDDDGVAGGHDPITAEQVKQISDLLIEIDSDLDAFCRFMNVEALPDIDTTLFPVAINALVARKNARAKRQ
jgi:hypothetical protein